MGGSDEMPGTMVFKIVHDAAFRALDRNDVRDKAMLAVNIASAAAPQIESLMVDFIRRLQSETAALEN